MAAAVNFNTVSEGNYAAFWCIVLNTSANPAYLAVNNGKSVAGACTHAVIACKFYAEIINYNIVVSSYKNKIEAR